MTKSLFFITSLLFITTQAFAGITCTTPRESKVIVIKGDRVSLSHPFLDQAGREIASTSSVRTKLSGSGFTKVLFINGKKHTIHIEDKKNFSELDDYLVIRSDRGHEMTYPLNCQY